MAFLSRAIEIPDKAVGQEMGSKGCTFKAFMSCRPKTFEGECDLLTTMGWIRDTEGVFYASKCAEEDKVVYAHTLLKAEALCWWNMVTSVRGTNVAVHMSWEAFKLIFMAKFCPKMAIHQLEDEFLRLEQGSMTVQEYTSKFSEKAKFAEYYVSTEEKRVGRYVWGLKEIIGDFVMASHPTTFRSAVNMAEIIEKIEENVIRQEADKGTEKRKWDGLTSQSKRSKLSGSKKSSQGSVGKPCPNCGRFHKGECNSMLVCYDCRKEGHKAVDCPRDKLCFICRASNHVIAKCPHLRNKGAAVQGGQSGRADDRKEVIRQDEETGVEKMSKFSGSKKKSCSGSVGKSCPKCGRFHKGECNCMPPVCYDCGKEGHKALDCKCDKRDKLCFICKAPDHLKANCPQRNEGATVPGGGQSNRVDGRQTNAAKPTGRTFHLTTTQAEETPDGVTANCQVEGSNKGKEKV